MKKILFVMYDMHCGGVEKGLISLLKEMDLKNYTVTLLLFNRSGEYIDDVPKDVNIKTFDMTTKLKVHILFGNKNFIKQMIKGKKYFTAAVKLISIAFHKIIGTSKSNELLFRQYAKKLPVYKEDFDLAIDYQGFGSCLFNTFFVAEKIKAKKKVSWIHTDVSHIRGDYRWLKGYYNEFTKIFSVSKHAEAEFINKFPDLREKSDIFYNILPVNSILNLANEETTLPVDDSRSTILSVGRLSHEKGYDVAFKAIKKLVQDGFNFKYLIIGEGEQRKKLERLIDQIDLSQTVYLLGFKRNPYPYIRSCDIYFQPSKFEGFSLTLGEAKVLSKPIVTTDFAGAREQVEDGKTGVIVKFEENEMYLGLKKMLLDQSFKQTLTANLKAYNGKAANDLPKLYSLCGGTRGET